MHTKFIGILSLSAFILIGLTGADLKAWSCAEGCERNHSGDSQEIIKCQQANCQYEFNKPEVYLKAYNTCKSGGGCDAYLRHSQKAFEACQKSCNDACKAIGRTVGGPPGKLTCQ